MIYFSSLGVPFSFLCLISFVIFASLKNTCNRALISVFMYFFASSVTSGILDFSEDYFVFPSYMSFFWFLPCLISFDWIIVIILCY